MAGRDSFRLCETKAEQVLREAGITSLPVDPFLIAETQGIVVKAKPSSSPGVSGMLVQHGDEFGILYATHIQSEGFQRFSVGHELGHFFLDGHIDHVLPLGQTIHESRSGFVSKDKYEMEADHFSAGLLMPRPLFTKAMASLSGGLRAIETLASVCRTSLTATAIRYTQYGDVPVAVVMTTGQAVDFCFVSEKLFSLDSDIQPLPKGSSIPRATETRKFNEQQNRVERGERVERDVFLQDWFGGRLKLDAREEVIGLGNYGKTLTVISVLDSFDGGEQQEEDEDAGLEESWTPRFRR